jgi:integrase
MALDRYLEARKDLSPQTRVLYEHLISRHLAAWLKKPIAEITCDMIEIRHTEIKGEVDRGPVQKGAVKTTGESTANGVMRVFRAVYNHALDRDDTLPPNPVRRLKRSWYASRRRETLVPLDKLPAFHDALCALDSKTASDYLRLILFTGMRRREAAALKWSEIDFAEKAIRLPASRTKARRRLDLPMSDYVHDLLVARRAIGIEGEFVFAASSRSGHIEEPRFSLAQIAKAMGILVSVHDLRRTYLTVAEGSNVSITALKALANHSLGSDVTSGYIVMPLDRLREPAQIIADRLKALCKIAPVEGTTSIREVTKRKGKPVKNKSHALARSVTD